MRILALFILLLLSTFKASSCGYGEWWDGMSFYNLFNQTNISQEEFTPFLRDESKQFFEPINESKDQYPNGNISLWQEILKDWTAEEIQKALYQPKEFQWKRKNSKLENSAKLYMEFAQTCSEAFEFRHKINSWNYEEIMEEHEIPLKTLLLRADNLLKEEKNQQLRARYYYQIIRSYHYSQNWSDAIQFYKEKVENQIPKNEIYYYILDQIAGCYYSLGTYDQAALNFAQVVNKSADRKKSAYISYNFCTNKGADGQSLANDIEDQKNLLFIKGLRSFSSEIDYLNKLIEIDANDPRVEVLFTRGISNVERRVWPKNIGVSDKSLPYFERKNHLETLINIAAQQSERSSIKNKDFWLMAHSYLLFINQDIKSARKLLDKVNAYPKQVEVLSMAYEVLEWDEITKENEETLHDFFENMPENYILSYNRENDLHHFILDYVAHTYYKNGEIAKAFLVHNKLRDVENIASIELLNALENFYQKKNKTKFEEKLIDLSLNSTDYLGEVNHFKGIYYLLQGDPHQALKFFEKDNSIELYQKLTPHLFSNNIKECFNCEKENVMTDEVYKADVFSFIESVFTRKELAEYLIQLEDMTDHETEWKAKLAHYLLGNFYYNISNTGYYRGILTGRSRYHYHYFGYGSERYANQIIQNKEGYNLSNIEYYPQNYFSLSDRAKKYYQGVIDRSTDKELNARCLYLMAKCDLNDYYNNGGNNTFEIPINKYSTIELPLSSSYQKLKSDYSDTRFYDLIIRECSYFRYYNNTY